MRAVVIHRGLSVLLGAIVAAALGAGRADARMTVVYDLPTSLLALISPQSDGSPGLTVDDGLYQQVAGALPADRTVGGLTGGDGSPSTPTIRDLSAAEIAALIKNEVDTAGAQLTFIDIGPAYDSAGADAANLAAAMQSLAATPHAAGGTYAERTHMYVSRVGDIADPESRPAFWTAMALTGGIWLEAYQGREQWPAEYWLAWPRALRDGLVARGTDPARLHIIVRGANQAAVWANFRVGAACDLLANGPGAYRIEDHLGFVTAFRGVFGSAPAPPGPSAIACTPAPTLPPDRAAMLSGALASEGTGAGPAGVTLSALRVTPGTTKTVTVRFGVDPFGIATRLGADPVAFWNDAQAHVRATGPGVDSSAPVVDGRARLVMHATGNGPIMLTLVIDGHAFRRWIGTPVDLALSLQAHRDRIGPTLRRMISEPTTWTLPVPIRTALRAAPVPPTLSVRVLQRRLPPKRSNIELRLSRPAVRILVELRVTRGGRQIAVRRVRITGRRLVVAVRLPRGATVRGRIVPEPVLTSP